MAKGMGKGAKGYTRNILIGTNVFYLACGIIVLICGIVASTSTRDFRESADIFRKTNINAGATTILVCGAVTIFATLIGFAGIAKANLNTMKIYVVLLGVTVAMQIAMGGFTETRNPDNALSEYWYLETTDQAIAEKQNYQNYLSCCGWRELRDSFGPGQPLCEFRCYEKPDACPSCLGATEDWIVEKVDPGVVGGIIVGCIEAAVMTVSCYIIMIMKKDKDDFFEDPFHY
jgi:hypothetical protein